MAKRDGDEREPRTWAAETVRRIGFAVKAARGNRSAKWLSDRTEELGYRISPTVIAKLDSGHRGEVLSVAELLIIAAALDVPPIALIYPNLPDGEVERLPGDVDTAISAVRWFTGETEGVDLPDRLDGDRNELARLLRLSRMREGNIERAERQAHRIAQFKAQGRYVEGEWAEVDFDSIVREIEKVIRQVRGGTVIDWPGTGFTLRDDDA